ncbi:DUF1631 family protein [Rhodoferax sp.]|uniref:DUF1631 family protein n=1 Tax=Rhodoferax sp. TaxID=50421 RepID=UPI0008C9DF83|nr:DUF1631 family protein [Rhodoferax sp.]MDO8320928.1 DUF1631 family protein [Rhodoferax sp.]MDP2677777.1 DUF1631 family protein [Rhodoferax sp.]OGB52609.1 MAG: hypothetical protein A2503_02055 [Burkholderiales bacterium RIFOXYD12_FULL_59_19]OGB81230.1 MAG: hypothetical protein A2496_18260 [Burkholderiales bacterium RIFOXYC12_FULL_60_6]
MVTSLSGQQSAALALHIRQQLINDAARVMSGLLALVQEQLTTLLNEAAPMREQQLRRDTWTLYKQQKNRWLEATLGSWQKALKPAAPRQVEFSLTGMQLVSTEVVDNRILASRIALSVMEVAASEVNDLRRRLKSLNEQQELSAQDIVHPEVLALGMVEQWVNCGFSLDAWQLINEVVRQYINVQWRQMYARCNAELVAQGVLPVIEFEARTKPNPVAVGQLAAAADGAPAYLSDDNVQQNKLSNDAVPNGPGWRSQDGGAGWSAVPAAPSPGWPVPAGAAMPAWFDARETGVLDRVGRLMAGVLPAQNYVSGFHHAPSPRLMAALAQKPLPDLVWAGTSAGMPVLAGASVERVAQVAGELQQQSAELKNLAQNDNEKAIIELLALMFQSILQEDRIPPGIRVWFARLQMPVLSLALAEPDFFNRLDHPARQLIDHMGSCALGFDASGISGQALETEIKRVVQVVEQYPDSGARVYQRVYEEFKEFLKGYLTQKSSTQKVVGVAQQVEQKETLAIQCTIELRNEIKDMPVHDEVRDFLYKVWSEVIAVASMRQGGQHAQTLLLKKTATDLIWAASAKPSRADRTRVIADLPELLRSLRAGMTLLGLSLTLQDEHIKMISDILADAFLSKTQAIDMAQIQALADRLANLEDYFRTDVAEDLPLDVQRIEDLLGIDASELEVVTLGGSEANPVMMAWAQNLNLGSWFTLNYLAQAVQVQYVWRSPLGHLHLFASVVGRSYLIQSLRLAAYLAAGLLAPQEELSLTVRATRDAVARLEANPERLLG